MRLAALLLLWPATAAATGFTDYGFDILARTENELALDAALRLRAAALSNLDLDRGPTPSGELFFPVSPSDPGRQTLFYGDMRLRADLAGYAPGGAVAVKARVDVLDNVAIGDSADGIPGGTLTQRPPAAAFRVKRAYGEIVTPLGYVAAGRMGHHWGLGMLANGGDCADCDSGDAADRVAFVTPLAGHLWALAYDFSATGYTAPRKDGVRAIELEPSAAVRSVSAAVLDWRDDAARRRRAAAGKLTFEYGAIYGYRWQARDIPAAYLPVADPPETTAAQVVRRGLEAHVADLWLRLTGPWLRVEAEMAFLYASIEQASYLPGLELPYGIRSRQLGAALESDFGRPDARLRGGLDAGWASGDSAPGFGARPPLDRLQAPVAGDLDGPQGVPPGDRRVDNFRFHPDYRVDRILFREIIGTVTDAVYLRPHGRLRLLDLRHGRLDLTLAAIVSLTTYRATAPGGALPLGVEVDPALLYHSDEGFAVSLEYAILFPLAGLDNRELGLSAKTAQLCQVRAIFGF